MIVGTINNNDLLHHPISVIRDYGWLVALRVLLAALDNEEHTFLDCLSVGRWSYEDRNIRPNFDQ